MATVVPVQGIGSLVLAADLAWLIGSSANQRPQFYGIQNAAQTVVTGSTAANLVLQSIPRDTDSGWNAGTNVYTVATAGFWTWTATVAWAANAANGRGIRLFPNGLAAWNFVLASPDTAGHVSTTWSGPLSAGQTVTAQPYQTTGGNLNTLGSAHVSMSGIWMGL